MTDAKILILPHLSMVLSLFINRLTTLFNVKQPDKLNINRLITQHYLPNALPFPSECARDYMLVYICKMIN